MSYKNAFFEEEKIPTANIFPSNSMIQSVKSTLFKATQSITDKSTPKADVVSPTQGSLEPKPTESQKPIFTFGSSKKPVFTFGSD